MSDDVLPDGQKDALQVSEISVANQSLPRYSVTIIATPLLLSKLENKYNLYCAWGFQSGDINPPKTEFNIVGWDAGELTLFTRCVVDLHRVLPYRWIVSTTNVDLDRRLPDCCKQQGLHTRM